MKKFYRDDTNIIFSKFTVFLDGTPAYVVESSWSFGESCCLIFHHADDRIRFAWSVNQFASEYKVHTSHNTEPSVATALVTSSHMLHINHACLF